jgi:hypothetical protein
MTCTGLLSLPLDSPRSEAACPPETTPESKALAYLVREVPRWSREHKCYSCHNNGDGARALYTARRLSYPVPDKALADTTRWLSRPQEWDHNGGETGLSDKGLARIQFAAALVDAVDGGQVKDRRLLVRAADLVGEQQKGDGSWEVDAEGSIGSPTTYGAVLATYQACRTLRKADRPGYAAAIAKAEQWLRTLKVRSVLDAAALLLALAEMKGHDIQGQQQRCLELIRKGESAHGGWGPYTTSGPEPFDTAMVVLALARQAEQPEIKRLLQRGRAYLIATQQPDGSWPETTRPPASESYAQRISTTAWATLAILATRQPR